MIRLQGVGKVYRMGKVLVRALEDINLEIEEGEMLAIMGPSGSGKSTLMNILGCLDRPSSGTYLWRGRDVTQLSDDQLSEFRNRWVGFVFQTFNLLPRFSALDNVELPLFYRGVPRRERRRRAREVLELVGLGDRIHHLPSELSGGERQRVAIARAVVGDPRLILADEPTGNLDSRSGGEIMNLFEELNRRGVTVVVVTHDPAIAERAPRRVLLRDGRVERDYRNGREEVMAKDA